MDVYLAGTVDPVVSRRLAAKVPGIICRGSGGRGGGVFITASIPRGGNNHGVPCIIHRRNLGIKWGHFPVTLPGDNGVVPGVISWRGD